MVPNPTSKSASPRESGPTVGPSRANWGASRWPPSPSQEQAETVRPSTARTTAWREGYLLIGRLLDFRDSVQPIQCGSGRFRITCALRQWKRRWRVPSARRGGNRVGSVRVLLACDLVRHLDHLAGTGDARTGQGLAHVGAARRLAAADHVDLDRVPGVGRAELAEELYVI